MIRPWLFVQLPKSDITQPLIRIIKTI